MSSSSSSFVSIDVCCLSLSQKNIWSFKGSAYYFWSRPEELPSANQNLALSKSQESSSKPFQRQFWKVASHIIFAGSRWVFPNPNASAHLFPFCSGAACGDKLMNTRMRNLKRNGHGGPTEKREWWERIIVQAEASQLWVSLQLLFALVM